MIVRVVECFKSRATVCIICMKYIEKNGSFECKNRFLLKYNIVISKIFSCNNFLSENVMQDFAPNTQELLGALSGNPLPYRTNPPLKISAYRPVVLFTKILTIDFDLKRKRTILFLFTKILRRILACKICRISTIVVTLS